MTWFHKGIGLAAWAVIGGVAVFASAVPETTGLSVDRTSRGEVVAFWNEYYQASEGAEEVMDWDGFYGGTCAPGTTSPAFVEAVERRINFYRAMAGISAGTLTNSGATVLIDPSDPYQAPSSTLKWWAAQQAALMFSYAGQLSHDPPPELPYSCWNTQSWNAAKYSNLALGFNGPTAIDAYMRENDSSDLSVWDIAVGHRRWLLMQGVTDFATGDTPGQGTLRPTNVLYVVPKLAEMVSVEPRFVAWPCAGYFPSPLMAKQWSLSHPDADFSAAEVTMTDAAGAPVAVTVTDRETLGLGDPSIVWAVPDGIAGASVSVDTVYEISVTGIGIGGETVSHSYRVTVIDPEVIPESLALTGTANPPLGGANYFFDPVEGAESHRLVVSRTEAATWSAGAEDTNTVPIIDGTAAGYALRSSTGFVRSGSKAFRLVFPSVSELGDQSFVIDREVIGGPSGQLRYHLRRGFMTPGMVLDTQTSVAGGPWQTVASIAGTISQFPEDSAFVLRSVGLPQGAGVRVRFRMRHAGGSIYLASTDPRAGAFIDDISFVDAEWAVSESEIEAEEGSAYIRLEPSQVTPVPTAGETVSLRLRALLGGRAYTTASSLEATFVGGGVGFEEWLAAEHPLVEGGFEDDADGDGLSNGLEYAFGLDPGRPSELEVGLAVTGGMIELSSPLATPRADVDYRMEVSANLVDWDEVPAVMADGVVTGTAPAPGGRGFARWKVTRP